MKKTMPMLMLINILIWSITSISCGKSLPPQWGFFLIFPKCGPTKNLLACSLQLGKLAWNRAPWYVITTSIRCTSPRKCSQQGLPHESHGMGRCSDDLIASLLGRPVRFSPCDLGVPDVVVRGGSRWGEGSMRYHRKFRYDIFDGEWFLFF